MSAEWPSKGGGVGSEEDPIASAALLVEKGEREAGVSSLSDSIDTVQSQSISRDEAEAATRTERDNALGERIDDEEAARASAVAGKADSSTAATKTEVSTEKSRAETAEGTKASKTELGTETTNRESADSTEKSRAETAEALKLAKASNLSDLANAGTARTNLGLGTAATSASTAFDAAGAAAAAQAASQPLDSDLTAIAALTTTSTGRSMLAIASAAAGRTVLEAAAATHSHVFYETHTWLLHDSIAVPSGNTNFLAPMRLKLAGAQTAKLAKVEYRCNNGASGTTFTFKLQKNGEDATGFTSLKTGANTSWAETDPTDVTLADGDSLAPVVTAVEGSPLNGSITLVIEHTVS